MLAVLPKQQTDDVGGELFVRAYERHLIDYPRDAISYLCERATGECRWFPTIAECKELLSGWWRDDEPLRRKREAQYIAGKEKNQRHIEEMTRKMPKQKPEYPVTQQQVDTMNPEMIRLGIKCGAITQGPDGGYIPTPPDLDEPDFDEGGTSDIY